MQTTYTSFTVTEGEILIDGVNIQDYSEENYYELFAVVFQDFRLFAFSVKENICLKESESDDINESVWNVLELVGVINVIRKLKNGIKTSLSKQFEEDGTEMSGGEKQKIALARAVYKDAPIVILDEPTAALDPVAEYEVYTSFNEMISGKTSIYISHRLSSCKFCDKIAVFSEKTIIEYGTHDELVEKKNGVYAELFNRQAMYYQN